jgi:hypothetical protein
MIKTALFPTVVAAVLLASFVTPLRAEDSAPAVRQASKHFQRGVSLYGEADYRAALVEFKRAYALAPNPTVLYNIGETQYQLQDYAGALTTFEHFLAETPGGDGHRTEVESDIEILRARVGHVSIVTLPPGAEVTVDDQPAGKTPFDKSLLVSIGHRKVVATIAGRPAVTRYVDVAADDNVTVTLTMPEPPDATPPPPIRVEGLHHAPDPPAPAFSDSTLRILGWTTTGALAAGAVSFGILAARESSDLQSARAAYPTSSQVLSHDASVTTTYSLVADSLGAAALVVGGVTLVSSLLSSSPSPPKRGDGGAPRVVLGPGAVGLDTTF